MEIPENFPLPTEEVERNREEGAEEEAPQEAVVNGASTEHLLWSESTPEDGSGEEAVETRTGEVVLLVGCANIGDLRHLVVEDGCADKSGKEGGKHLAVEGDPRRDVGVMSEFEILRKLEDVGGGNVPVDLEVDHVRDVTREYEAAK